MKRRKGNSVTREFEDGTIGILTSSGGRFEFYASPIGVYVCGDGGMYRLVDVPRLLERSEFARVELNPT